MAQILHSIIAIGNTILVESSSLSSSSNHSRTCRKVIKKIHRGEFHRPDGMATLLSGSQAYNYIHGCEPDVYDDNLELFIFLCVTDALPYASTPSETREIASNYLNNIRQSFFEQFNDINDINLLCDYHRNKNENNNNNAIKNDKDIRHYQIKNELRQFGQYMDDEMNSRLYSKQKHGIIDNKDNDDNSITNTNSNSNNNDDDEFEKVTININQDDNKDNLSSTSSYDMISKYHSFSKFSKFDKFDCNRSASDINDNICNNNNNNNNNNNIVDDEKALLLSGKSHFYNDNDNNTNKNTLKYVGKRYCNHLYKTRILIIIAAIFTLYLLSALICGWNWNTCAGGN